MRSLPKAGILAAALLIIGAVAADAAVTEWQDIGGGRMRLAAELDPASGKIRGVIDVELKEGWKTYWQEPGDSGIPPQFDFSASRNFAVGAIQYPVPERIELGETAFAGYRKRVLFGFTGAARDADGQISMQALIGVCEEICIPATAQFEIPFADLRRSDIESARLVAEAARQMAGHATASDFKVEVVRVKDDRTIEATATVGGEETPQLFAVGPVTWRFSPGRLVARDGNTAHFEFAVYVVGGGELEPGAVLQLTLAQGGRGVEQELTVRK
jgi:DsbC/DsbD-like thiol-disulfide interchange protein